MTTAHRAARWPKQTAVGEDREVASASTLCRLEKWANKATAWRLHEVLVEQLLVARLRQKWPQVRIAFRSDSGLTLPQPPGQTAGHQPLLKTWCRIAVSARTRCRTPRLGARPCR